MKNWKKIWHENRLYFSLFIGLFCAGLVIFFSIGKGDEILFFNQRRGHTLNFLFIYGTQLGELVPFVVATFFFLFTRRRMEALTLVLAGLSGTLLGYLLKLVFGQPRPKSFFTDSGYLEQLNFVEGIYVNSGNTSFPSGHTLAAFVLFSLLAFFAPRKKGMAVLFLFLAVWVGLSRVYLVQHFLQDVLFGSFLGVLTATVFYWLFLTYWKSHADPAA